jgi:5-(carboxyamino)imidazole ribonucleotide synthase
VGDDLLPGILKTARLGYDGKGQVRVPATAPNCAAAWDA